MKILKCMTLIYCIHLLGGCASTSELYAEYDSNICPVHIASAAAGKTVIRDRVTAEQMVWRPAVYFEFDQSDLRSDSVTRLSEDLKVLNRYPELRVAVRGFTDVRGSNSYNVDLAEKRVANVVGYLQREGVPMNRIDALPLGESLPLTQGDSEQAMANNRRVELLLLDRDGQALDYALEPKPAAGVLASGDPGNDAVTKSFSPISVQGVPQEPAVGAVKVLDPKRIRIPAVPVQTGSNSTHGRVIQ